MTKNRKRLLAAVVAVGVFGAVSASAATLGGLDSVNLGADSTSVVSCDENGVALDYTSSYDAAANTYKVDAVVLSDVSQACTGQDFAVTLSDGTSTLVELTGTVAGVTQSVELPVALDAGDIEGASVVISG